MSARHAFFHERYSYSGHELRWPLQNAHFIGHSFQAERPGPGALAVMVDDGFHNLWDAYFGEELRTLPMHAQYAVFPQRGAGDFAASVRSLC